MASNLHSNSARIAFFFFLLLAFAVELHECRRAPGKDTPVLVQNCNKAWTNSEQSMNAGTAQRKPPAPTQVEYSVEQGVGPERLFMVTDNSPVPPTPLNPSQLDGIMVTDNTPVPPTPLNPSQPGGIMVTDNSPVPPTPLNPSQAAGGIMVTDNSPVPSTPLNPSQPGAIDMVTDNSPMPPSPLNPSQPGYIMVTDKSPVPPTTLNPSQLGARMLSGQDKSRVPPTPLNAPSPSCC